MKLAEYDFVVEHRPNTQMRHADALSRCVNMVEKTMVLSNEDICEEQQNDEVCQRYKLRNEFWTDDVGILFRRENKNSSRLLLQKLWSQ